VTPANRALARLWVGLLLPPVAWMSDFMIRYFAIRFANIHDRRWPMALATAAGLVLLGIGASLSWRGHREAKREAPAALARWGLGLAAFFLLLILAQAFPGLVLGPREIT
jgi:hypothetical protein